MAASMKIKRLTLLKSLWTLTSKPQRRAVPHTNLCLQYSRTLTPLFRLLSTDSSDPGSDVKKGQSKVNIPHPKGRYSKDTIEESDDSSSSSSDDDDSSESASSDSESDSELDGELADATEKVAKSLGGDVEKTRGDLLAQLSMHKAASKNSELKMPEETQTIRGTRGPGTDTAAAGGKETISLQSLFSGIRIAKRPDEEEMRLGHHYKDLEDRGPKPEGKLRHDTSWGGSKAEVADVKLFSGERLGIFEKLDDADKQVVSEPKREKLFNILEGEERAKLFNYPPTNAFQEAIKWTRDGKLRSFPANNEEGMDEEMNVGFHEHVFLDYLLEGFPRKGPIRHFMELVTAGLSQNPHFTIAQKREHVEWFRGYFDDKQDLMDDLTKDRSSEQEKIEA